MATISIDRRALIVVIACALVSLGFSLWSSGAATRERALNALADRSLDELASLATVRGDEGELLSGEPLGVHISQEAGEVWVRSAVQDAVADSAYFRETDDTQNALRAETLESDRGLALQLHLLRRGWEVRAPHPRRIRVIPWAAVLAGLLGALVALASRRASAGLVVSGVIGQGLLAAVPVGNLPLAPQTWSQEVWTGPLVDPIVGFVQGWGPMGTAIAGGVVVFCAVLVVFDHRRSKGREQSMGLGGAGLFSVLAAVGVVCWVECALRASFVYSLSSWQGALAGVALVGAWIPALRGVLERFRG